MKGYICLLICCTSTAFATTIHTSGNVRDGEVVVACSNYQDARAYLEQLPEPFSLPGVAARIRDLDCVVLKSGVSYKIKKMTTVPHLYEIEVSGKYNAIHAHAVIRKIKD